MHVMRSDASDDSITIHPEEVDPQFDRRGWVLVGAIIASFLVVPGIIYVYPYVASGFGRSFILVYIFLPLFSAIALGLLAVWATTQR